MATETISEVDSSTEKLHFVKVLLQIEYQAALATLHQSPEPSSCKDLAIRLQGATEHVMRLMEALLSKATNPTQDG